MLSRLTHPWQVLVVLLTLTAVAALAGPGPPTSDARATTGQESGAGPVVKIDAGALRGAPVGAADAFLGVPYAAAPVKALRFAPPQPPESWRGVRDATRQAPACLQFQPGGIRETQATSEDCL